MLVGSYGVSAAGDTPVEARGVMLSVLLAQGSVAFVVAEQQRVRVVVEDAAVTGQVTAGESVLAGEVGLDQRAAKQRTGRCFQ